MPSITIEDGAMIFHTDRRLTEAQLIQFSGGMTLSREVSDNMSFRYCMTYRDARSCTDLSLEFSLTGLVERQMQTNNDQIEIVFLSSGINSVALRYSCNEGLIAEPDQ